VIERYCDPEISLVFNRDAEVARWARVEMAVLEQVYPDGAQRLSQARIPTGYQVDQREQAVGHEFQAFLDVWRDWAGQDDKVNRLLHYGLTSSDVIDCGQALALEAANSHLFRLAFAVRSELAKVCAFHTDFLQIGRTHGRYAVPRRGDSVWRANSLMFGRQWDRWSDSRWDLGAVDLSGPVGARTVLHDGIVLAALEQLGLHRVGWSTQIVPRDSLAHWAATLAGLCTVCENVALQVRLLAQSGVDEVQERSSTERVGSSSMPHKRNPILAENICGLARMARTAAEPIQLSMLQWHDRDLTHSSVERVVVPDLCHLAATILQRTTRLLADLEFDRERIRENLEQADREGSSSASQMDALIQSGMPREQARHQATGNQEEGSR